MKILMIGLLAALAFVLAVQVQAAEVIWQKDVTPVFDTQGAG